MVKYTGFISTLIGAGVGTLLTLTIASYNAVPRRVYLRDLTEDGIQDVIITYGGPTARSPDKRAVFIGQSEGDFKSLEELQQEQQNQLNNKAEALLKDLSD